jgi:hypothetical protein
MSRRELIRDQIQKSHQKSWPILTDLSPKHADLPVYKGDNRSWTVKDIVIHLADAERGMLGQLKRLVSGQVTVPPDFDLSRWNRSIVRKRSDSKLSDLLLEIQTAYTEVLDFLEGIDQDSLDLEGRHPTGEMLSAEGYFLRIANHRLEHAVDIRRACQKVENA